MSSIGLQSQFAKNKDVRRKNRFEDLKVSTCLLSSWFWLGGGAIFALQPGDAAQKIIVGGTLMLTTLLAPRAHRFSPSYMADQKIYSLRQYEQAPRPLKDIAKNVARKMDFNRLLPVNFFNSPKVDIAAHCSMYEIAMSKDMYHRLNNAEREFIIAHEASHQLFGDITISGFSFPTRYMALGLAPYIVTSAYAMAGGGLSGAFAAAAGLAGTGLMALYNHVAHKTQMRVTEYRADRKAAELAGDPLVSISAIAKIVNWDWYDGTWMDHMNATHPTYGQRIARILDDFNHACPDRAIHMDPVKKWAFTPIEEWERRMYYDIDARPYNGKCYQLSRDGLHPAPAPVNPS